MFKSILRLALLASAAVGFVSVAHAQDGDALTLSGNASLTSDYRFRGISQTQESVAVQGGLDASYALSESVSLFAGTWGSTGGKNTIGASEIDVYGGVSGTSGLASWSVGALGYLYADATDLDFWELHGEVGMDLGPARAAVGVFYAPDQANLGNEDGIYVYTSLSSGIPNSPVTLKASVGYEDNAFWNSKWDWSLGADVAYRQFTFGVAYVDTNKASRYFSDSGKLKRAGDAAVIFTVGASF